MLDVFKGGTFSGPVIFAFYGVFPITHNVIIKFSRPLIFAIFFNVQGRQ